jgi:Cu(I)/Ag(I) efflux system periplasmic protein CusF
MTCLRSTLVSALVAATALASPAIAQQSVHSGRSTHQTEATRAQPMYEATGTVVGVDAANRKVGLNHGPVETLGWPAMKMAFSVVDTVDISGLKPGDQVQFTLLKTDTGPYPIAELCLTHSTEVVTGLCTGSAKSDAGKHDDMPIMTPPTMHPKAAQ